MNKSVKLSLTSHTIALALLGLAVFIAGAGWFVVVSPKRSQATELAATIQSKQSELSLAQRTPPPSQAKAASNTAGVGEALPDDVAMPQVVEQLNALATRADVSLDTVTPQPGITGTGYVGVPLNVVIDGRYFNVEKFLRLVRTQVQIKKNHVAAAGRLYDVQRVQLQQTEPAPTVTAVLTLEAFYYSPATTTVDPNATTTTSSTDATATTTSAG
jgi:Tfp pilus assembly protein PilO